MFNAAEVMWLFFAALAS